MLHRRRETRSLRIVRLVGLADVAGWDGAVVQIFEVEFEGFWIEFHDIRSALAHTDSSHDAGKP